MTMTSQFADMTLLSFFLDVILILLSRLVAGPSFMSISSLVAELWQFAFIRDWPKIRKSEISQSEFCTISWDCGQLEIPNLAQISLIKCYWMQQNARVIAFTLSELLRENQLGRGELPKHIYAIKKIRCWWNKYLRKTYVCSKCTI